MVLAQGKETSIGKEKKQALGRKKRTLEILSSGKRGFRGVFGQGFEDKRKET